MAKKKTQKNSKKDSKIFEEKKINLNLKTETIHWLVSIAFFVLALFFVLASFQKGGMVGSTLFDWMTYMLGIGYFLLPALFFILGVSYAKEVKTDFTTVRILGSIIFILSGLGIIDIAIQNEGGLIGNLISSPVIKLFDVLAGLLILSTLLVVSIVIIFDTTPDFKSLMFWKKEKKENIEDEEDETVEEILEEEDEAEEPALAKNTAEKSLKGMLGFGKKSEEENFDEKIEETKKKKFFSKKQITLPLSILSKDKGKPGVGDIKANANIIKRALQNFGIIVEMDEISIGPSVTRYALKPAEGVKLSRIVALQNDLSLALAAHPLRIEAPIPGKALVGIEIPNSTKTTVGLATLFESPKFQDAEHPLTIALGKDISGNSHFTNLAKAPHMLIAGSTGSGKSVTIHTLITSLLYRNNPEDLRLLMIDPKRVELTLYKNIPHLLTPVITDPKKAILSLKWAIKEMERRYEILEGLSVRDIQSYHKNILEPAKKKLESKKEIDESEMPETMPYIVVIIDELADIMQTYPRELESAIVRLAQMSRAVGIHLILSTQRPSVNVITGLIKANVPTRVALQVASQVDSRTILDQSGAEKLLGAGDMLYLSGDMSKPRRIQAAFISETEVKDVVKFLKRAYEDEIPDEIDISVAGTDKNVLFEGILDGDLNSDDSDDLYESAREEVIKIGKASTSYIQRKLRVGYARAARLMDMLEERGVIGPADGSKPREVLIGKEENSVTTNTQTNGYLNEEDAEEGSREL
ncbi:TPA: cell division protein FtsK [Candidatus Campbellbacteria bacterium]|nr:MAG: cell division protein ftsK, DNA segregation ATPase FtsK/SpoIIIE, S-DNA-T family [Candidatus Campbellbacteria bacterium GW2011_OD1_34_28]KKP75183.1 MAG: translocase FtsK protein [Candidatus Campbellbacteria bacterium GW2011_GWD2_35_24]KKP76256.1 MAG: cell division protein ftsK, DNA segregation ATPase FtsK/SpoIIIE, S-DNA-T family [Candidatus Campbellbacteria bacterium GW2011_GWC2_35_28]KKP77445.1 MAG: translocase FtsK protein [Candidatus Campbellbacteria bacterium GW2011_GWC1_35_31]KKP793